jgi:hypothetical protein
LRALAATAGFGSASLSASDADSEDCSSSSFAAFSATSSLSFFILAAFGDCDFGFGLDLGLRDLFLLAGELLGASSFFGDD